MRRLLALTCLALLLGCPEQPSGTLDDDDSTGDDDSTDDDDSGVADDDSATADPCDPNPCDDPELPYCIDDGICVACRDGDDPAPEGFCQGICADADPICVDHAWSCSGVPGYEEPEVSCDGFDNDCDGEVDEEGICPDCTFPIPQIEAQLHSMWDVDFDFDCNTYLTTNISGPDYTTMVPMDPAEAASTWYGNANQNMGFALVDPDPANRRVVVTYQCCPSCGCMATNGLTLLYTCDPSDPGCGCVGQANCPGFLDQPFLPTGQLDTTFPFNGWNISTPNGLAVGPRNSYYVGNFRPQTCSDEAGCLACDPDNPGVYCTTGQANCCDDGTLGRLARFTLPTATADPTWRVVAIFEGEEILGLAAGRDGSVLVGTKVSASEGRLYRIEADDETPTLLATYEAPVYSITQARWDGDWYIAVDAVPEVRRLAEDGVTPLTLPAGIPMDPPFMGVLEWAPDGQLYRLIGRGDSAATLEVYPLP